MSKKSRRQSRRARGHPGTGTQRAGEASRPAVRTAHSMPHGRALRDEQVLISVVLAAAVGLVYLPALRGEFINLDDPAYVTLNPHIRDLSWTMISWAFTSFEAGNWHPLTWVSLAFDYQLYGLQPYGYHLTSVALHVVNALLVFLVLHRLTGARWRSATVAAVFGLHPLRVESVAWVAERKDVLCALFWLLTIAAYARYVRIGTWTGYVLVVLCFAMALLSKPMAVTLPVALLLLDYWPLGRLSGKALLEKVPLLVLGVTISASTLAAAARAGALEAGFRIPLRGRLANAVVAYVKYLGLTLWPLHLSPWYSHPSVEGPPLSGWMVPAATGLLVGITAFAVVVARGRPYVLVGWVWYLVTLLPVIGLVQAGGQAMADRYTYIPHIGLVLAVVWSVADLPFWTDRSARSAGVALGALLLICFGVITVLQTQVWHDTRRFWTYTVTASPRSFMGHQVLGNLSLTDGRFDQALDHYRRAARLRPEVTEVHRWVGDLLAREGKIGAAAAQYRKVVQLDAASAESQNSLAAVLLEQGRPVQARRHLERALALRPDLAEAHNNLGRLLRAEGRLEEAVAQFRAAVQAKPNFPEARTNLTEAIAQLGPMGTTLGQ